MQLNGLILQTLYLVILRLNLFSTKQKLTICDLNSVGLGTLIDFANF
jgi:hypothetical protein